jgi:hypothetical protein
LKSQKSSAPRAGVDDCLFVYFENVSLAYASPLPLRRPRLAHGGADISRLYLVDDWIVWPFGWTDKNWSPRIRVRIVRPAPQKDDALWIEVR